MQLQLQDFTALVRTQAAAAAVASRQLIDVSVGSVLRAVLEANAAVGLWIQWLIVEVLATTRAATSGGADLDSWMADFGLARLPASPATGLARFSRATAGLAAVVPVGAVVRTGLDADSQAFHVSADPGHPAWTGGGYRLAASDVAVTVPVVAVAPGRAGNVQPAALRLLSSAIPGVDGVTNEAPAAGGLDAEADDALRVRFGGFIDSRTRATPHAVEFAIRSLRQGLQFAIEERVDTAGATRPGHFTVTVDDGSGAPSPALIDAVAGAIDAIRPVGGTFSVRPPLVTYAAIEMHAAGPPEALAAVRAAVGAWVAALPIGARLVLSRLVQVAHDADPAVASVWGLAINSAGADLAPPAHGLVRLGSLSVLP